MTLTPNHLGLWPLYPQGFQLQKDHVREPCFPWGQPGSFSWRTSIFNQLLDPLKMHEIILTDCKTYPTRRICQKKLGQSRQGYIIQYLQKVMCSLKVLYVHSSADTAVYVHSSADTVVYVHSSADTAVYVHSSADTAVYVHSSADTAVYVHSSADTAEYVHSSADTAAL